MIEASHWLVDDLGRTVTQAGAAEQMAVSIEGLDESLTAVRAFEKLVLSVDLLVLDHIAELRGLKIALEADEHLVGAASLLICAVVLRKAHMARVFTVTVALALLDGFCFRTNANCRVWSFIGAIIVAELF